MRVLGLVAASGVGSRFGAGVPKQFVKFGSSNLLKLCIKNLGDSQIFDHFVVATQPEFQQEARGYLREIKTPADVIVGGGNRRDTIDSLIDFESSRYNLVENDILVLIDANRPLTPPGIYSELIELAGRFGCAIPVGHLSDGLGVLNGNNELEIIKPRENAYRVLTPEAFRYDAWLNLPCELREDPNLLGIAEIFLAGGQRVQTIFSDHRSLKVTYQEDVDLFLLLMEQFEGAP